MEADEKNYSRGGIDFWKKNCPWGEIVWRFLEKKNMTVYFTLIPCAEEGDGQVVVGRGACNEE